MTAPRFAIGAHVRGLVLGDPRVGLCGTVASVFEFGGLWVYGVMYDDHTPESRRPFGRPSASYPEQDLELAAGTVAA